MIMEEKKKTKKQSAQRNPNKSSQQKTKMNFGASGLHLREDEASHLVGHIVEKGISDEPPGRPYLPPTPTVLPFPVARRRSHGPHWAPVGSNASYGYGDREDVDDDDGDFMKFDPIAPFANPVERKNKKGVDFSNWRELVAGEKSAMAEKSKGNMVRSAKSEKREKDRETISTVRESEGNEAGSVAEMEKEDHYYDTSAMATLEKREKDYSTSTVVSSETDSRNNKQESMTLESEIDAENRARLQGMAAEEIAEAQAEIMEKMDPTLLRLLKKRGQEKLKKKNSPSSDVIANVERDSGRNESVKDVKGLSVSGSEVAHTETKMIKSGLDNGEARNLSPASSSLWSAWSERVESVRVLRFSLDGTVVENDLVPVAETERVAERDFLRTEGDPGAAGYTIKEAVALTRSVIPGQRALALHILLAVLDKAVHNICQGQVGCSIKNDDKDDTFTNWEAVWAYALGPEPKLVLSLRICLDDNHNSVVLACAKVIQCILTCEANESFFNFSEKISTLKDICTAPVFRSKPEIDVGFLHGGFWKYNAKTSNVLTVDGDIIDNETEGKHTIQDDIVVAGQDFAAGLVRMGILSRLRYLLESDPTAALEECLISILIAIARHSPTCANAIMRCQRLVETVVDRFASKDNIGIHPSKIKSVILLKVLVRSDKKNCLEFIKNGVFHIMTWHLCQNTSSVDRWVESGPESCKLSTALMVEQLRFWRVCIKHGYSVSCFSDIFPSLCLWLNPPTLEKLIENGVLREFASLSVETYLLLQALAARLPSFFSQMHLGNQIQEQVGDDREIWSWSHVSPMIDLAVKWILVIGDLHTRDFWQSGVRSGDVLQDSSVTSLLWVCSAVMGMLAKVLKRIIPDDTVNQMGSDGRIPWLPEFVPKIGLEIIKSRFLSFSDTIEMKFGTSLVGDCSFIEKLCDLRQKNEHEISLASVCCLHGFVQTISTIDYLIQLAKKEVHGFQECSVSREEEILKNGILKGSLVELRNVQNIFIKLVASEWQLVQSIETFHRGGPAPGVGVGWGASGGGFWSTTVLLVQADSRLTAELLETFLVVSINDVPRDEEITSAVQIINSSLALSLLAGPRDINILNKAFKLLVHVSVLKYLDVCIRHFHHLNGRIELFGWEYKEEDYLLFSEILISHFSHRWLSVKKRKIADITCKKGHGSLSTIHEDEDFDTSDTIQDGTALVVEWAHQRLPLPVNWFLSPISTLCNSKDAGCRKCSNIESLMQDPGDLLQVAKAGLFFLLGIEAMLNFLPSDVPSPVQSVPLVWKLHSLSVILLIGMAVIEDDKSKDVYEALQNLYGDVLNKEGCRIAKMACEKNVNLSEPRNEKLEFLRFQSDIHDSYSTFVETLVEQFSAISYGNLIYGRQVAIYLHRCVEAPVRLAAWNALTNARVLELLPPLESCFGEAEGYLQPIEDNTEILEAYVKSWTSGALDRAASRGSIAYALVLHHLSHFIFNSGAGDKLLLRNKLVRSLLRNFSQKQHHEAMMMNLLQYDEKASSQIVDTKHDPPLVHSKNKRLEVLTEACERNSSLLNEVEKLKFLVQKTVS